VVALAIAAGGALAASAAGSPRRQVASAELHLSPAHPSASLSRRFVHADVGIASVRITLPRDLHAELLIRNPVESATGQGASTMLCVPFRACRDAGRTALRFCRGAQHRIVCTYRTDSGPAFPAGPFTVTVRELASRNALVALRVVFVRGL
jgi:hypothetical protein